MGAVAGPLDQRLRGRDDAGDIGGDRHQDVAHAVAEAALRVVVLPRHPAGQPGDGVPQADDESTSAGVTLVDPALHLVEMAAELSRQPFDLGVPPGHRGPRQRLEELLDLGLGLGEDRLRLGRDGLAGLGLVADHAALAVGHAPHRAAARRVERGERLALQGGHVGLRLDDRGLLLGGEVDRGRLGEAGELVAPGAHLVVRRGVGQRLGRVPLDAGGVGHRLDPVAVGVEGEVLLGDRVGRRGARVDAWVRDGGRRGGDRRTGRGGPRRGPLEAVVGAGDPVGVALDAAAHRGARLAGGALDVGAGELVLVGGTALPDGGADPLAERDDLGARRRGAAEGGREVGGGAGGGLGGGLVDSTSRGGGGGVCGG